MFETVIFALLIHHSSCVKQRRLGQSMAILAKALRPEVNLKGNGNKNLYVMRYMTSYI